MLHMPIKENLRFSVYYAPRGRYRLYILGSELSQRFLYPTDILIGIIGPEGAGKSTLIRGLFPGLELTNEDDGMNKRSSPIFDFDESDFFSGHTFHLDVRHELAFHQLHEIVEAIMKALNAGRRVIVEHFDMIYKALGSNAQIIFGIGEEVRVYRPSILGPSPTKIMKVAEENFKFRLMAHSAEDIVEYLLVNHYNIDQKNLHSDVRHGFVIGFDEKIDIDLHELEEKAKDIIAQDLPITALDGDYISIGDSRLYCTGKRIHVKSTGKIENFRLLKDIKYDPISKKYLLIGLIDEEFIEFEEDLPPPIYQG
ncbi:MAG TPA: alanine-tRNA synthetase second additional domain-containing protein [Exilispira sp.]|nr:alanine-tRNA synthetase second additional domain-containing protein [Exilispira sp.]